jgi:hypothetical protein
MSLAGDENDVIGPKSVWYMTRGNEIGGFGAEPVENMTAQ